jgi:hypothetical protein
MARTAEDESVRECVWERERERERLMAECMLFAGKQMMNKLVQVLINYQWPQFQENLSYLPRLLSAFIVRSTRLLDSTNKLTWRNSKWRGPLYWKKVLFRLNAAIVVFILFACALKVGKHFRTRSTVILITGSDDCDASPRSLSTTRDHQHIALFQMSAKTAWNAWRQHGL